jgi:nicotinic acid mononucleotide adenylyltransferase
VTPLEVSSSALRDLLREGGDPRYLVTDGVRSIIMQTGCYARSESRKPAVATE